MPIALAPLNEEVKVAAVRCDNKENSRLAALGLTKDAKVTVLSSSSGGAVVILLKGSRLALDRITASKIFVA